MSFGASNTTKTAENNLGGIANQASANSTAANAAGASALGTGQQTTAQGTNFFQNILNGNRAQTSALLQPSIDQIRQAQQGTLQAASTLMPRGGGRSATLFQQPFNANSQIQSLFNGLRAPAASTLASTGLQQQGIGTNLFNVGNQALNTGAGASANLGELGQRQQQITNGLWSGLGAGLFGLATTPFGGANQSILQRL